jgi:hypothetical protein
MEKYKLLIRYQKDIGDKKINQCDEWKLERYRIGHDNKGSFIRVGSWMCNFWFNVALSNTEIKTLSNAVRRLKKWYSIPIQYEYVKE